MRKPQNAPPRAPARAVLVICFVLGFLLPCGQVTTAASTNLISCCCCSRCRIRSAWSAPSGLLNSNTDRVDITYILLKYLFGCAYREKRNTCASKTRGKLGDVASERENISTRQAPGLVSRKRVLGEWDFHFSDSARRVQHG